MAYRPKPRYLFIPAKNTTELAKEMDAFLEYWLDRHKLDTGEKLYHYTTLRGLRGIVKSRQL